MQARRRKWKWAARFATLSTDRWAVRAYWWNPAIQNERVQLHGRRQGHPRKRWDEDVSAFVSHEINFQAHWTSLASNASQWDTYEE
eukprot:4676638-Karenia_brevis.AAC.1